MALKRNFYSFETKLQVVFAKKEGMRRKDIQKKFQIRSTRQIDRWSQWFNNHQSYRLQQKLGHTYSSKTSIQYQSHSPFIIEIKQKVKKLLNKRKQSRHFYLNIINKYKNKIALTQLTKILGISKNSYYHWLKQQNQPPFLTPLDKAIQNLCAQHQYYNKEGQSFYLWGHRRIYQAVKKHFQTNLKEIYLKMKKLGLLCQTLKNKYVKRERKIHYLPYSSFNLIKNNFQASRPYQKLCTDITYLTYGKNQTLYLSVIMDLYNREIVTYNIGSKMTHEMMIQTLKSLPQSLKGCLFHSDQGSQYTSKEWQKALQAKNFIPSFSERGQPSQNACIEAFFGNLKAEFLYLEKKELLTKEFLMHKIPLFIQNYNQHRPLAYLGYLSPLQFKAQNIN
ncbi:MAG: IS3 family transposase [Phytoplasma sp.]|uniref:IS3 family transposase n=1 Tax=Phytoplasma sp. TaxID=2155 RepID=UPI002B414980|nr:IS3 family transposase [Phytoplasma sp.]WRH06953.1 MAG: IS3 family transposase [Phytoplasma sp.]